MSFTIGRASLPRHPQSAQWSGDNLTIAGWISPTTAQDTNHAFALRQQLLGMANNPDEDVFPCTFSVDSNWDGFYRINSVNVDGQPGVMENSGYMPYTISLTRVGGGFAMPVFETVTQSITRTNSHGVTVPTGELTAWYSGGAYTTEVDKTATLSWASEDGNASFYFAAAPQTAQTINSYVKPADYYKAAAKIEVQYGSTWYPIVGQHLPLGTSNWRINNGLVRLYPTSVSGNGRFTMEQYNTTWKGREFGVLTNSTTFTYSTTDVSARAIPVSVLVNRPEIVVLRMKATINGTGTPGTGTYDFVLRRGDLWCEIAITQLSGATTQQWGIGTSAVVASTAFTGGARATANDANGLRYLVSSPSTISTDLVNGRVYLTAAASTALFQVTPDYSWAGGLGDTNMRDGFLAARSENQRIVHR